MNRRGFLRSLGAVVAGIALGEAIPFNRVWSFPSQIVVPRVANYPLTIEMITRESLEVLKKNLVFSNYYPSMRVPQRYSFLMTPREGWKSLHNTIDWEDA